MSYGIIIFVNLLFQVFMALILVEVLASWILASRVRLPVWVYTLLGAVHAITSPILNPIRRLLPSMGGLDFSPLIALLLLQFLRRIIINALSAM